MFFEAQSKDKDERKTRPVGMIPSGSGNGVNPPEIAALVRK
jgi:hypothetical protein